MARRVVCEPEALATMTLPFETPEARNPVTFADGCGTPGSLEGAALTAPNPVRDGGGGGGGGGVGGNGGGGAPNQVRERHANVRFALNFETPRDPRADAILSHEAMGFLARLVGRFDGQRRALLASRKERQAKVDAGELPDFNPATAHIREGVWRVAPIPEPLLDRRVEITGPADRKMIINALNSGARVFMADFEDATSPTWENLVAGQLNLRDAVAGTLRHVSEDGREYVVGPNPAVLLVRPRGLHLPERNVRWGREPIGGCLFDFALFLFHNAHRLIANGAGPYFYLPKLEHSLEARWWCEVIDAAEDLLELPRGTVKVTVLVETLPGAFQMEEILYELREHVVGLNCGRWDYIFSYLKTLRASRHHLLPEREKLAMSEGFLRAYSERLIGVCHRRGALALGGMAAQIPIRNDEEANKAALAKVVADKEREARAGHDGTWVAHPGLVAAAMEVFDRWMPGPNQLDRAIGSSLPGREDLLRPIEGTITERGVRGNLRVSIRYVAAWLAGQGCVPIDNLMEDAATAEIARTQLWQWARHPDARLADGRKITFSLLAQLLEETRSALRFGLSEEAHRDARYDEASAIVSALIQTDPLTEFLTLVTYDRL